MNIMYFSADWCAPCKVFKPIVQQVSQELRIGVNYINVDYDASYGEKYSINSIPTLIVLDNSGTVLYRNSGVMSKDELIKELTKFK
jgi:thioredoxin 1